MNSAIMPISTAHFFSPAIVSTQFRTRMEELEFLRANSGVRALLRTSESLPLGAGQIRPGYFPFL